MPLLDEKKIKVAVKVNGGFGTVLVRANYLYCLKKYINDADLELHAFAHKIPEINDAIFYGVQEVHKYYHEKAWNGVDHEDYALVLELDLYIRVIKADYKQIEKSPLLVALVNTWYAFQKDEVNSLYYRDLRCCKPYEYRKLIRNDRTVLNSADVNDILDVGREYRMPIHIEGDEEEVLNGCGLRMGQKFITIQRGNNPKLSTNESPKLWPVASFEKLAVLIKKNYPNVILVQLGESVDHCKALNGIDVNLVGQTTWNDLKVLLKHAILHIDSECGMVHLRKALHKEPSLVFFGPTPVSFFGYDGNINLKGEGCPDFCAELREDWEYRCIRNQKPAPCMESITAEMAFDAICNILDQADASENSGGGVER